MAMTGADSRQHAEEIADRVGSGERDHPRATASVHGYRRGLSTIEYTVLIVVVAAALLQLAVYTMRALCGRWRQVGDQFSYGRQYDPGETVVTGSP